MLDNLVGDIYNVIRQRGGWTTLLSDELGAEIAELATDRFINRDTDRTDLRMSMLGYKCSRKQWYMINAPHIGDDLTGQTRLKFFYGDMIEALVIKLIEAAGYRVEGKQDELDILGVKGHRDIVVNGVLLDVKSCSPYSWQKFKEHKLEEDDPFGYLSQISSYLYASKNDPLVTHKNTGGFIAINKVTGEIALDLYHFDELSLAYKEIEVESVKTMVNGPIPQDRLEPVTQRKDGSPDGNLKLCTDCSYCDYKKDCWPEMRTFLYSYGPEYLVRVVNEPRVPEAKEDIPLF